MQLLISQSIWMSKVGANMASHVQKNVVPVNAAECGRVLTLFVLLSFSRLLTWWWNLTTVTEDLNQNLKTKGKKKRTGQREGGRLYNTSYTDLQHTWSNSKLHCPAVQHNRSTRPGPKVADATWSLRPSCSDVPGPVWSYVDLVKKWWDTSLGPTPGFCFPLLCVEYTEGQ